MDSTIAQKRNAHCGDSRTSLLYVDRGDAALPHWLGECSPASCGPGNRDDVRRRGNMPRVSLRAVVGSAFAIGLSALAACSSSNTNGAPAPTPDAGSTNPTATPP